MKLSTLCLLWAIFFGIKLLELLHREYWARKMVEYMLEHPDECDLCAYYAVCMNEPPPPHNCAEERAAWQ